MIVANTTYQTTGASSSTDMLGLVANQFVQVYHPVISARTNLSDSRNPTSTFTNPQIHAAMLALGHSSSSRTTTRAPSWGPSPSTG